MRWDVVCPACGGPGRIERDWRGDEVVECDGYAPCHPMVVEAAAAMVEDYYGDPRDPELHWDMLKYEQQIAACTPVAPTPLFDGIA